ncbi:winged helix-turn-helix domain-containing protein [Candidatus Enterococcus clewellii]|uniref:OmpR/PhoB-type domain-containing protein n=1 Tax=Candidatus Enterococcus clewellii TaxID=1834193 RepID=A0A242K913_9ENTE|nr:winged helix-turn-helix domain-containing protein [Enterococcus sp. 9E7_DIV0242]OTP17664.1 hypothetical protein A5888_001802 [Enterococcus sp. 9E7_DIV0242]
MNYYLGVAKEVLEENIVDVNDFSRQGFSLHVLDENARIDEEFDAVILNGNDPAVAMTSNIILRLSNTPNVYVWTVMNSSDHSQKNLYLNLGAAGVFCQGDTSEQIALTIKNILAHSVTADSGSSEERPTDPIGIKLIPNSIGLKYKGKDVYLTKNEYQIMEILINRYPHTVSYSELAQKIWRTDGEDRKFRVANLVHLLRNKLKQETGEADILLTVRSKGYRLNKNIVV